jgi:hypothetical protein
VVRAALPAAEAAGIGIAKKIESVAANPIFADCFTVNTSEALHPTSGQKRALCGSILTFIASFRPNQQRSLQATYLPGACPTGHKVDGSCP